MTKRSVEEFFNDYAGSFDSLYHEKPSPLTGLINRYFRKSMRKRFEMTLSSFYPLDGRCVLDVGCGPGHYAIALARLGAARVVGIDFADRMVALAKQNSQAAGMQQRCEFIQAELMTFAPRETFDYSAATGFMDYVSNPSQIITKILELTRAKAIFSFPKSTGLLAWQRKIRYRQKCDLYLYHREQVHNLFSGRSNLRFEIADLGRDFFVTVSNITEPTD